MWQRYGGAARLRSPCQPASGRSAAASKYPGSGLIGPLTCTWGAILVIGAAQRFSPFLVMGDIDDKLVVRRTRNPLKKAFGRSGSFSRSRGGKVDNQMLRPFVLAVAVPLRDTDFRPTCGLPDRACRLGALTYPRRLRRRFSPPASIGVAWRYGEDQNGLCRKRRTRSQQRPRARLPRLGHAWRGVAGSGRRTLLDLGQRPFR